MASKAWKDCCLWVLSLPRDQTVSRDPYPPTIHSHFLKTSNAAPNRGCSLPIWVEGSQVSIGDKLGEAHGHAAKPHGALLDPRLSSVWDYTPRLITHVHQNKDHAGPAKLEQLTRKAEQALNERHVRYVNLEQKHRQTLSDSQP